MPPYPRRRHEAAQPTNGKGKTLPYWSLLGRRELIAVAACTAGINALALAGPLYMLLLHGRVLPAHDLSALLAATAMMLTLYACGAALDLARQRVFARCAHRVDLKLAARTARRLGATPVRDLDQVRTFLAGHGPSALCDLPWLPFYAAAMFALHPLFGVLASVAALAIAGCLLIAARLSRIPELSAARSAEKRWQLTPAPASRSHARDWFHRNARLRHEQDAAARPAMAATAIIRALRPALQSATLGLGVYLAMTGACAPASILAASIIMPRVIGPIELVLIHWRGLKAARTSAQRLQQHLTKPVPAREEPARRPGVQIILRKSGGQARSASGAGVRSMSSGLRPTAE
jgi:ABC-type protease/lipase transport system fused ATPase/permease subunit